MWSREEAARLGRLVRSGLFIGIGVLLAGCFQPLYGERPIAGSDTLRGAMRAVDVEQIAAARGSAEERIAVQLRNALLFNLAGGAGRVAPTHRLNIRMIVSRSALIVDPATGRTVNEITGVDTYYKLTEIATGKIVVDGQSFARVGSDVPGLEQRFALWRGEIDAEERASKVVAEQITNRITSYLAAGT
jgi:LPS-assembly lipoprotein